MAAAANVFIQILSFLILLAFLGISIATLVLVIQNKGEINKWTAPDNPSAQNTTVPNTTKAPDEFRLPPAAPISPSDPRYLAYSGITKVFRNWMNHTVDPCEDFYSFTCGSSSSNGVMGFTISDGKNMEALLKQVKNNDYIENIAPRSVVQLRRFFDKCMEFFDRPDPEVLDGTYARRAIDDVRATTGMPFPMLDQTPPEATKSISPDVLAKTLGYLRHKHSSESLLAIMVDTNWKEPHGSSPYFLYIDQPSTIYSGTVYRKVREQIRAKAIEDVLLRMTAVATIYGKKVDTERFMKDATDIIDLDFRLATDFNTDDYVRRKYERRYNPMTIGQLQLQYPMLNWLEYMKEATASLPDLQSTLDESFVVVLEEPKVLSHLQESLGNGDIPPALFANYVMYRFIDSIKETIPSEINGKQMMAARAQNDVSEEAIDLEKLRFRKKKRATLREDPLPRKMIFGVATTEQESTCMSNVLIGGMQWAATRMFTDALYPTKKSRSELREKVGSVVRSILVGFRSEIDQLNWMSHSTKKGAYEKLDNLVINIGFPDWVMDDKRLDDYHATLSVLEGQSFMKMRELVEQFSTRSTLVRLLEKSGSDRTDFTQHAAYTNAWYLPEANSITIPAGILHQPFFDPDYPTAINYGALGAIVGHEVTHGFDDHGVQFDGTGILRNWMDSESERAFSAMAQCVIDEYDQFCPLPQHPLASCIDGKQTQGENIADNGGVRAAFRGFMARIALDGSDPRLPDEYAELTPDQQFFLGFSQVWCEAPPAANTILSLLLTDEHSPFRFRVFGSLQNFAQFKASYNCRAGAAYAPKEHCEVWTSDVVIEPVDSNGVPIVGENELNIDEPEVISRMDPRYSAYQEALAGFKDSIDFTADPCEDFYGYICGNCEQESVFDLLEKKNQLRMVEHLKSNGYQNTIQNSTALQKLLQFYDLCRAEQLNPTVTSKMIVNGYIAELESRLGHSFPILRGRTIDQGTLSPEQLATALGYLQFAHSLNTLFTTRVDTNWLDPIGAGYQLYIDQSTTFYPRNYYQKDAWARIQDDYVAKVVDDIAALATAENATTVLPKDELKAAVEQALDFERQLGTAYTKEDRDRRVLSEQWNPVNRSEAQRLFTFIDWTAFLALAPEGPGRTPESIVFNQVEKLALLSTNIRDGGLIVPTTLANYLFIRLILNYESFIPGRSIVNELTKVPPDYGESQSWKGFSPPVFPVEDDRGATCMVISQQLMTSSSGRVFVDAFYPTDEEKRAVRNFAGGVIKDVIVSFTGMLGQLDWMDATARRVAQGKMQKMVQNIAFPDRLTNNTVLDEEHAGLSFEEGADFYSAVATLIAFNVMAEFDRLSATTADRTSFGGKTATTNAWFQSKLNSITFPGGLLQPPFFDINYPAAFNYGALGIIAGHEIVHAFDFDGQQMDADGALAPWVDSTTQDGFDKTANCIVKQYDRFCLLNSTFSPNCVSGLNTLDGNVADNGGIHAAWRAYQQHVERFGGAPLFDDRIFAQFTWDQLFFLNFGKIWCRKPLGAIDSYRELLASPYSPFKYRVLGTLQNIPAFRAAFNCPANSLYSSEKHCDVWVPMV